METETRTLNEAEELGVHRCSQGKEEKMWDIISRPCDGNSVFVFPSLPLCLFSGFKVILEVPSTVILPPSLGTAVTLPDSAYLYLLHAPSRSLSLPPWERMPGIWLDCPLEPH